MMGFLFGWWIYPKKPSCFHGLLGSKGVYYILSQDGSISTNGQLMVVGKLALSLDSRIGKVKFCPSRSLLIWKRSSRKPKKSIGQKAEPHLRRQSIKADWLLSWIAWCRRRKQQLWVKKAVVFAKQITSSRWHVKAKERVSWREVGASAGGADRQEDWLAGQAPSTQPFRRRDRRRFSPWPVSSVVIFASHDYFINQQMVNCWLRLVVWHFEPGTLKGIPIPCMFGNPKHPNHRAPNQRDPNH